MKNEVSLTSKKTGGIWRVLMGFPQELLRKEQWREIDPCRVGVDGFLSGDHLFAKIHSALFGSRIWGQRQWVVEMNRSAVRIYDEAKRAWDLTLHSKHPSGLDLAVMVSVNSQGMLKTVDEEIRDCRWQGEDWNPLGLQPGDKVMLKSGGPEMTIEQVRYDDCPDRPDFQAGFFCSWDRDGTKNQAWFDGRCLVRWGKMWKPNPFDPNAKRTIL